MCGSGVGVDELCIGFRVVSCIAVVWPGRSKTSIVVVSSDIRSTGLVVACVVL